MTDLVPRRALPLRRRSLTLALACAPVAAPARAADPAWPSGGPGAAVRLIVPYAAGGPSDNVARILQPALSEALGGRSVVVENRPGAAALVGTEHAARADANTLLVADSPHTIAPAIQARMPFDARRDFLPVGLVGSLPMILATRAGLPVRDVAGLAEAARRGDDAVSFGSAGPGSLTHLLALWFAAEVGARVAVAAFRGSGPALLEVAAGRVDAIFTSTLAAQAQLRDGSVRALARSSDQPAPAPAPPGLPTLRGSGVAVEAANWWGILSPAAAPGAAAARDGAERALAVALANPATAGRLAQMGLLAPDLPAGGVGAPFAELLDREFDGWARVVARLGAAATG